MIWRPRTVRCRARRWSDCLPRPAARPRAVDAVVDAARGDRRPGPRPAPTPVEPAGRRRSAPQPRPVVRSRPRHRSPGSRRLLVAAEADHRRPGDAGEPAAGRSRTDRSSSSTASSAPIPAWDADGAAPPYRRSCAAVGSRQRRGSRREFRAMHSDARRTTLPAWRIVAPAPAEQLLRFYKRGRGGHSPSAGSTSPPSTWSRPGWAGSAARRSPAPRGRCSSCRPPGRGGDAATSTTRATRSWPRPATWPTTAAPRPGRRRRRPVPLQQLQPLRARRHPPGEGDGAPPAGLLRLLPLGHLLPDQRAATSGSRSATTRDRPVPVKKWLATHPQR